MKKIISLLLVFVMLMSFALVVRADAPPYSKDFSDKGEMLSSLSKYSKTFPDVEDYTSSDLSEKRERHHLERREVFVPYIEDSGYTATSFSYAESEWGKGVNYIFASYSLGEENVRIMVFHGLNKEQIEEGLVLAFVPEARFFSGEDKITGKVYGAAETPLYDGAVFSEYVIKSNYYDDILTFVYTNSSFDEALVSNLQFEKADFLLPVYVEDYEGYNDRIQYEGLFFEKFYYANRYDSADLIHEYRELYYHYDEENNMDWALICTSDYLVPPWNVMPYAVFGQRVLRCGGTYSPFVVRYGIYDVNKDIFTSITNVWDTDDYADLHQVLDLVNAGELIGDTDKDSEITIKDATLIQKCLASLCEFADDDAVDGVYTSYYGKLAYISDFDRDGERTIKDATAIQKHIAGLEY